MYLPATSRLALPCALGALLSLAALGGCSGKADESGDSGDSGAGDSGAGDSGAGDSGAGDSGDSGAGDSGDSGAGDSGDSGAPPGVVSVSNYFSGEVRMYDRTTAESVGVLVDVDGAQTLVLGPDGALVVCAEERNQILRYDPAAGMVEEVLVGDDPATADVDETGGLDGPTSVAYAPDGTLLVASFNDDRVLRYDADGAFLGEAVAAGAGGLDGPDIGMVFGPDGDLYVAGWYSDAVHRYDGATFAYVEDVVTAADGLDRPRALAFDAAGGLWVSGRGSDAVFRRDPGTGVVSEVVSVQGPTGIALDEAVGEILVASDTTDSVKVFDLTTGEGLGPLIRDDALDGVTALTLLPPPPPARPASAGPSAP